MAAFAGRSAARASRHFSQQKYVLRRDAPRSASRDPPELGHRDGRASEFRDHARVLLAGLDHFIYGIDQQRVIELSRNARGRSRGRPDRSSSRPAP